MELSTMTGAYEQRGQVATVYLESRPPAEDAAAQLQLRWQDLAEQLRGGGADEQAIAALDTSVRRGEYGWLQGAGRVLAASSEGVVFDAALDAAQGAGDEAYWAPLPHLGRYLREQVQTCRLLLILADQEGATVRELVVSPERGSSELQEQELRQRSGKEVHKPRGGDLANRRIQNRAEEAVLRQADEVIEHVRGVASRFRPAVIVLSGSVQARTAIRGELPPALQSLVVETEHGARAAGASDEPLENALGEIAHRVTRDQADEDLERLRDRESGRRGTEGLENTVTAARAAAVEVLLLEHGRGLDGHLWVGPGPEQIAVTAETLHDLGVDEPRQVDAEAALVRCCAATGAGLRAVPAAAALTDGVGALLRFDPGL